MQKLVQKCFTLKDEANVELAVGVPSEQLITWLTDDVASSVLQDTISIDLQCSPNLLDGRCHHFQHNLGDCLHVLKRAIKLKDEIQPKDWNNGFFFIKPMKLSNGKTPSAHAKQPVLFTEDCGHSMSPRSIIYNVKAVNVK